MVSESQDGTDQRNRRRTKREEFKTTVRTLPNSRGRERKREKEREMKERRGRGGKVRNRDPRRIRNDIHSSPSRGARRGKEGGREGERKAEEPGINSSRRRGRRWDVEGVAEEVMVVVT